MMSRMLLFRTISVDKHASNDQKCAQTPLVHQRGRRRVINAEASAAEPVKRGRGRPKGTKGSKRVPKAPKADLIEALEAKIDKLPNGDWVFRGTPTATGHATLYYGGAIQGSAHRVAYEVWVGNIPPSKYVLQRCGNKLCVNPAHLYLANYSEVIRLRDEAGRSIKGERNPKAKLTPEKAAEIRKRALAGEKLKDLCREFGVAQSTISQIKNGVIWKESET